MSISRSQSRAARGKLGWSQGELAAAAGVHKRTVADWERGERECFTKTIGQMQRAFADAGIQFVSGSIDGVQWHP